MLRIVNFILFLFLFLAGILLGGISISRSKELFYLNETKNISLFYNSSLAGLSMSLVVLGGIFFLISITDNSYHLIIKDFLMLTAISLVPGLIVFLGSLWQYFLVRIFRDGFIRYVENRRNNHNR